MPRKHRTLEEFVKHCGGQEKAARVISISFVTLNRYLNNHRKPEGEEARKMRRLGIIV